MKRLFTIFLSVLLIVNCFSHTVFAENAEIQKIVDNTASYIKTMVKAPTVSSVGGEWAVIGLARSDAVSDDGHFSDYYKRVEEYTAEREGVLHKRKYTEYSRVVLALTAIGKDPRDVGGYNLLLPLSDYEKTVWQGINGPIWALIALDSNDYEIPENPDTATQATREMYINYILECQNPDGGWSLNRDGEVTDVDITAMALCALAGYRNRAQVENAVQKALLMLSLNQKSDGGFSSGGAENCESSAQVLTALCELGIAYTDVQFTKNGNTVLDSLLTYYNDGGFLHIENSTTNQMATEQAFYALVALNRFLAGKPGLYDMTDATEVIIPETNNEHFDEKTGKSTFADIVGHKNQKAVEILYSKGIINGKSYDAFAPDALMTRAEFATIAVKAMGFELSYGKEFEDVNESDWFYPYINTACKYGIVKGVSEKLFNPYSTITRQEATVMLARCAVVLGIDTEMEIITARDILAEYTDYVRTASWAMKELAFCCEKGIIEENGMEISPEKEVDCGEIAQMIYNLLEV